MLWKRMVLVATVTIVAALSVWGIAFAQTPSALGGGSTTTTTTNPTTQAKTPSQPACTPLRVIYSKENWRNAHPLKGQNPCPAKPRAAREKRDFFYLYRHYRIISPYRGFNGRGTWLQWVPIPAKVIDCEGGTWDSHNPSGADGPAQLLGHGQPDVNSASSARIKVLYWVYVRRLYLSEGLSPWEPSRSCWG